MANLTINPLELASELANTKLIEVNLLKPEMLPNGINRILENGDIIYTEEAQDLFNQFYTMYLDMIKGCSVNG